MENYIPKIRFKGAYDENGEWVEFTHPWEQRKLGELASSFEYGLNAAAKEYDGENKYIRITDIDNNTHEFLTDNLTSPDIELTGADNYKLTEGDILFARTGASVGKSYIYKNSDGLVYYAGFLIRARIEEEYDAEFVFQNTLTDRYNKYIAVTSQRSGQPGVNAQEYAEFEIKVPKKEEQTKIGTYFRNLDNLITLHQRKCDLYQQAKQSMMEKLYSFNSDWEEKALGEILIRNPKSNIGVHEAQQMKCGDIPYFTSGEKIFYINDFLVKGENIFVNDGGVADIKYYNGKANYSDHILSLKNIDNSICLQFVYQSLLSKIKIINDKLFHGLGLKNLSKKDFMNFTISIPDIEEQIKIANVLSKYDELIAISKNQLDSIKTLKKGLLQQMFI